MLRVGFELLSVDHCMVGEESEIPFINMSD